jgi:WD40 repeat protein
VRLWNADDGKALGKLRGHPQWVFGVAFMPDKDEVVSSCKDGTVFVWDVAAETPRLQLKGPGGAQSVAVSPDGATIAAGYWDWSVRLWDSVAGKSLGVLRGHTIGVYGLAFSLDGTTLVSSSGNYNRPDQRGEIKIWDVKTASAKHTKREHAGAVWTVCFSPDGKTLVTGGADQTVRLWDHQTGEQRAQLDVPIKLEKIAPPVVADGDDAVQPDRRLWLLLGAGTAIVVVGGLFLAHLLRKRSRLRAPETPESAGAAETVNVECVGCHKRLKVPADVVGKKVKCPSCATAFVA